MINQIKRKLTFLCIFTHFLLFYSCSSVPEELEPIRVGVLLSPNSLPMIIADKEGFFKEHGIKAKIISYQNADRKNEDFKQNEMDVMITDLASAIRMKEKGARIKILSLVRGGLPRQGKVAIITGPNGLRSIDELSDKTLAIIPDSISEFVADQLLESTSVENVHKTPITTYSEALQKLLNNELDAGVLVNPLVTFAEFQGCRVLADDSEESLCFLVLVANEEYVKDNYPILKNFINTYFKVVDLVNTKPSTYRHYILDLARSPCADPESIRSYLLSMTRAPKRIKHTIPIPEFSPYTIPSQKQVALVNRWLKSKELISREIPYDEIVDKELNFQ
jgi:NitT/TauT family transport system substrate-binding protein